MADQLASPEDLASLLERDDIDLHKATRLVEIGTAIVQQAAGRPPQRLIEVVGDNVTLLGSTGQWLDLPQRPVTDVASVAVEGIAVTAGREADNYRLFGSRLWRAGGWAVTAYVPSDVDVVYSHGYPDGDQGLELAAGAVLSIITGAYGNPSGLKAETIDDYSYTYAALSGQLDASKYLKKALCGQYGRGAGIVRVG